MSEDPAELPKDTPNEHIFEGPPTPDDFQTALRMNPHQIAQLLHRERSARSELARNDSGKEAGKYDEITGLPFGTRFREEVNKKLKELNRSEEEQRRSRAPNDALVVQLDGKGLKGFNTLHGHTGGNKMLSNIGVMLSVATTRPEDMIGRLRDGGDEFAIVYFFRNDEIEREAFKQMIDERLLVITEEAVKEGLIGGLRWCSALYEPGEDFLYHLDKADPEEEINPGRIIEFPSKEVLPARS